MVFSSHLHYHVFGERVYFHSFNSCHIYISTVFISSWILSLCTTPLSLSGDAHMTIKGHDSSLRHQTLMCMLPLASSLLFWLAGPLCGLPVSAVSRLSQSSLRMWAGAWHWESAAHSCSHSTKTSMWHLTAMPDERRTPPQTDAALPFKMRPRGPCPERWHLSLRNRGSLRLFFPPTCGLLSVLGC